MRGTSYACLGDVELSNGNRTLLYLREFGIGLAGNIGACECDALDEPYPFVSPSADPAPWFDANVPESEEFYGVWLSDVILQPVMARSTTSRVGGGAVIGPLNLGKRIIACKGLLFASTGSGMAFGERWFNQALAGSFCGGDCAADDLEVLPACPELDDYADYARFFRTIINTGVIDGPNFGQVQDLPDCKLQTVDFQLSGSPYLFGPKQTLLDRHVLAAGASTSVMASTNAWPGDATIVITVENPSTTTVSGSIDVQSRVSFDGTCNNLLGNPCWKVIVNSLKPAEILIIDGHVEQLNLYKPGPKVLFPGLGKITTTPEFPFFTFPSVTPCTDACWEFSNTGATEVIVSVDQFPREF